MCCNCRRNLQKFGHHATSNIYSFLPSKAGVGTSTIALNISSAIATKGDQRVMLADFDLSSGMQRFLLKLNNTYSVMDAIEHSLDMDEALWPQLVTNMGNMDVLHSGRINPSLRIEGAQVRSLIQFMRRNYQVLCFDLSGNLERYSLELMQESKKIFVVVTPEIPSLHVAREKIAFLREMDLGDRVAVILNRAGKKPVFGVQQVQDILGSPVVANLANDYLGVNNATSAGGPVEVGSELGKQFSKFALGLIDKKIEEKPQAKKSFLDFLTPSAATSR